MFDGFTRQQIKTQETTINLVREGSGFPILLLHGYPQTHVCWHRVAPILAERFTVVCPDLWGCGDIVVIFCQRKNRTERRRNSSDF
jgi:haloacetate dehalogenase